jgi:hypothetical protein
MLYELLGALVLLIIVLLAWIVPHQRAALAFTEAEVAFLFPAPITRRGLIHFKLLRSQAAILFTTILLTLITNRLGGQAWIRAGGWWLILSLLNLHLLGSSFARTLLLDRGITHWQRRLASLLVVLLALAGIFIWAKRSLPPMNFSPMEDLKALQEYVRQLLYSGPLPYLLFPFRLTVRPFLATDFLSFARAAIPALVLLVAHYWWVIRSDVAFEEASADASKKLAEKMASIRAGHWQGSQRKFKGKRAPFKLGPLGPAVTALLWKNLISAGQAFTLRVWVTLAAIGLGASIGLGQSSSMSTFAPAVGMAAAMLLIWSVLIGGQLLRHDLRQDILLADVLKTFPLRGWQIVLGELLAPTVILTGIQWFLLMVAVTLFSQVSGSALFSVSRSLPITLALALFLPMITLITLQIPNAAVLLFPAWFQTGKDGPHGVEATGQRLIFILGQFLVLGLALVPAGGVFAGVFYVGKLALGVVPGLALGAVAAAIVLAVEAGLGVVLLGWLFERFDISAELNS